MKVILGHVLGAVLTVVLGMGAFCAYQWYHKNHLANSFSVTSEQMAKDLEGRQVSISHGQVWPFDKNQGLSVSLVAKKQVEQFVIAVVDVRASAVVEQPKAETKTVPKSNVKVPPAPKVPSQVSVSGYLRLTYESIGGEWYLVGADALTAKAAVQFD